MPDSTVRLILPFVQFSSDLGWVGGGALEAYNYGRAEVKPYNSLTQARLQLSTQGRIFARVTHERLRFLNSAFRVRGTAVFERLINDRYFGLGNNSELKADRLDEQFYRFESRSGQLRLRARYPFLKVREAQLDLLLLGEGRFYRPIAPENQHLGQSFLFDQGQEELKTAKAFPWIAYLGAGLLWDNRDREIDTRRGTYAEFTVRGAPALLSAEEPLINASLDLRGFYTVPGLDSLILAGRLGGEGVVGKAPFWLLPALGGENNLRGYHLRRFRDEGLFFNSFIARKWLVGFDWLNLRVGLQALTEGGRTFGRFSEKGAGILQNHKRSYGGGLLLSAFTRDFILRFDYATSNEVSRIYLNLGYVY
jgi:outer membrane protein assembly factor BamA